MKVCDQASRDAHALKCGLAVEVLHSSGTLHLRVMGWSMLPTVWPGDTLIVERLASNEVFDGDIVLFSNGRRFVAHRVVDGKRRAGKPDIQTKGDAVPRLDSPVPGGNLLGKVSFIVRNGERNVGTKANAPPMAATSRVCRTPMEDPSRPPSTPPMGIVPHTRNRMVAFIRPSNSGGHSPCRKLTWVML